MNTSEFAILVLFFNKVEQTIKCLESFKKSDVKIYVLNNGSTSKSVTDLKNYLKDKSNIKFFDGNHNLGVSGGRNYLIRNTSEKWLFFLDNDIFTRDSQWLDKTKKIISLNPNIDVFIPRLFNMHDFCFSRNVSFTVDKNSLFVHSEKGIVNVFPGGACIINRDIFKILGMYDEKIFVGFEDHELAIRAILKGRPIKCLPFNNFILIHDHKFTKNVDDLNTLNVRYDSKLINNSCDVIKQKYGIDLDRNFESWIDSQKNQFFKKRYFLSLNQIFNLFVSLLKR